MAAQIVDLAAYRVRALEENQKIDRELDEQAVDEERAAELERLAHDIEWVLWTERFDYVLNDRSGDA